MSSDKYNMGDFGKFGTFSKPSGLGEAREEPTVLTPATEVIPEARKKEAATKEISKPKKEGKPIDTYEKRVGKFPMYGGVPLGTLCTMHYKRWQHDPNPLAIFFSVPRAE